MTLREREARLPCTVRFRQAAEGAPADDTAEVEIEAYNGGIIDVGYGPEVVDLSGIEHLASIPLLVDHDRARVAGFSTEIDNDRKRLIVKGKLLVGDGEEEGRRVRARAKTGFPYQASIGWRVAEDEYVPAGQSRTVNGQTFAGPFLHDKRTQLKECSVVPLGADSTTKVKAAAAAKESVMDPVALERQRVKDIKAAFPDDREFADQHIEAGTTLADAKVAYADRAAAEVKKLREEKAAAEKAKAEAEQKLEAERKAKAPSSTLVPAVRPAGEKGATTDGGDGAKTARARWDEKVRAARERGLDREAAVKAAMRDNPDLHREMLAEANPGKSEPAYRVGR
jgi:phage head maturation protease